jgi:hypothetical protein
LSSFRNGALCNTAAMLAVANEVSGTVTLYGISEKKRD